MKSNNITLGQIRHKNNLEDSLFLEVYQKLLKKDASLSEAQKFYILKIAIYFLNSKDDNIERLGYRLILMYSNQYSDYRPLFDVALSRNYIPVSKFIERKYLQTNNNEEAESFSTLYIQAFQENFRFNGDNEFIYRSGGQMILSYYASLRENVAIVAPTSYGKSEMMIKKIPDFFEQNVCILVPSKALLAQTKKVLLTNAAIKNKFKKIITHPDMFKESDAPFLAVLTQERLLRLLQRYKGLAIDLILVDEAHNILEDSQRSHLLAQVLLILQKRNPNVLVNFFTPFIVDVQNLAVKNHQIVIKEGLTKEFMKIERFYGYDFRTKEMFLYDQFLNRAVTIQSTNFNDEIDFITYNKASKNIIYLNRPKSVEEFSLRMANLRDESTLSDEIQKVISSISEFIHQEYNLITCIKKGILFHHGGMPDIIRLYVEYIFSRYPSFEFIITTSTLLEGVNIPAEKIFLLTPRKGQGYLSPSQFKNLIGRVCRFKDVFDNENGKMTLLEPEVYLLKGDHAPEKFSLINFYSNKVNVNIKIKDDVQNPLLENTVNDESSTKKALEYLENMEQGASGLEDVIYATTAIGQSCFTNNIHDFDIMANEVKINSNFEYYKEVNNNLVNSAASLIEAIVSIFFDGVELSEKSDNIVRIKNEDAARKFYIMFIGWRIQGAPYPYMISRFLKYWERRIAEGATEIYIGSKWGDIIRGGHQKLWVNMNEKSETQKINLAIAKIKEEQEFIDFNILKYLEILRDLEFVDNSFYDQVKYGTSNVEIICLLKNGFSMELSKLLISTYKAYIELDVEQESVSYNQELINVMRHDNINDILIFEATCNQ
jgi:hypothetical protein